MSVFFRGFVSRQGFRLSLEASPFSRGFVCRRGFCLSQGFSPSAKGSNLLSHTSLRLHISPFTRMFSSSNYNQESWKLGRLNHVAIAVPDLKKASEFYKNILGAKEVSEAVPQPEHGVYTVFVNLDDTKIELLHPYGDKSPIQNFLDKNKNGGIHHVCIEVDDVKTAIKDITSKGIRVLDPEPKIGAHGNPVVFLHPKDCCGVLVELEEVKKS
ncbi:Glyoxalase/Bleomycin resistance protein/Dihydroxybiphenyl dioxygenase [Gigaspora rosea]|uniref:Methylmalonyl-CoA epimerase, mitochondrial n=1 Tax=Gigaspora rosea TaxID=44941 RepID=A0A397UT76_9GLOM|nr:Glyoxalase/Bleomycin resistance protein/Dihydroxybiphenyl dioxygenase [Gigaspora rosea]